VLENVNPDLSDSEYMEPEAPLDAPTPAVSDFNDHGQGDGEGDGDEGEEDAESEPEPEEGDIDEELAAELDMALGDEMDEEDEEGGGDDDDEDDESEEDDDDDDDDDDAQARKLVNEEIRDLEAAVAKKQAEIASSSNTLIRVCAQISTL